MNATSGDRRRLTSWALAACVVLGALPAYGSGAENVATARELYKQGADALDAGKSSLAVERLTAAWALVQTPVIGFDLARAHLAMGHLVEAREAALAVARTPVGADETARSTQARADADKLAVSIGTRIPHVNIRFAGGAIGHGTVKLDGIVVPEAALTVARQTNPGAHTATVDTDDGRHAEGAVTVAEGETKEIVLTLPPPPAIVTPPPVTGVAPPTVVTPPGEPVHDRPPATTSGVSPLVWIGAAAGGVGLAVGAITGAFALSKAATVRDGCNLHVGADIVCPSSLSSDLSAAHTFATVSTIGFITAGVGAGVLMLGLVLGGKRTSDTHARVVPMFGPISGVAGTF